MPPHCLGEVSPKPALESPQEVFPLPMSDFSGTIPLHVIFLCRLVTFCKSVVPSAVHAVNASPYQCLSTGAHITLRSEAQCSGADKFLVQQSPLRKGVYAAYQLGYVICLDFALLAQYGGLKPSEQTHIGRIGFLAKVVHSFNVWARSAIDGTRNRTRPSLSTSFSAILSEVYVLPVPRNECPCRIPNKIRVGTSQESS